MSKTIYSDDHQELVVKLKKARKIAKLTQIDVADALGVTQSLISKIENGQVRLDIIQIKKLAKLYQKPVDYFLG